jgi:L-gulono-1,4-lactone dehydrogenase
VRSCGQISGMSTSGACGYAPTIMPPRFENWSGLHGSTPRRWDSPSSEAELAELLSRASREGRRVRAVGSGHSWSDVAVPEDIALDLRRHTGVVSIDEQDPSIVVRAGTRLEEITRALDARGLAMPILGSIAKQTIAGAISTATHGSSLRHGNLASLVRRLRLVTPRGEILELDARDPRFDAARVSLGALGVITQVELGVTRAFRLMETREALPFAEVVRDLEAIAASAEFVKLWWLPSTGRACSCSATSERRSPSGTHGSSSSSTRSS